MNKLVNFASKKNHLNALLCSSAAILLTACGGGSDGQNLSETTQQTQTAARVVSVEVGAGALKVAQEDGAGVTQVDGAGAPQDAAPGTLPGAASQAPADFALRGYTGTAFAADTGAESSADSAVAAAADDTGSRAPSTSEVGSTGIRSVSLADSTMSSLAIPSTPYKYYVAPTGSDTAAGTASAPFKTLARAARAATRAGTTVFVAPGTYAGGFKTTYGGTASARIYYVSTTKWGARIVPPASSVNNTAWDNRGSYVSIVGFDIDGTTAQSGTKWTHGIYNGGSYDAIVENRVHHIAKTVACTSGGGSAIGVDSYYHGVKSDVISNMVYDVGPAGCRYIQGIYISTSGTVKNNVVYRVSEAAIHLWHDANNVIITNNTVAASNTGIIVGGGDTYYNTGPNDYTYVYSNIVYDNKYGISEQGRTGTHNSYRNNLVYQNTYNWTLKNGLTHTGTVSSAPYFTYYSRTGTPNFKPSLSSPAIGRGSATYAHPTDIVGRPRNSTTGFDIGAYQH